MSATATPGAGPGQGTDQETQMLLDSLQKVISNQTHEIETLQKDTMDLAASNETKGNEVLSAHWSFDALDLLGQALDYIPESSG